MPMVFASPGLKWEGFGPHAYEFDGEKARDLPLTNQQTGENTTIGDILTLFRDQKVVVDHPVVTIKLVSTRLAAWVLVALSLLNLYLRFN
jgi:hypothetical protein